MENLFNFQKEYEKHLQSNELKAIEAEFIDKPYFLEEKGSALVAKCCSYFFNFLSVLTASTLLYLTVIKFFDLSLPYQVIAGIFILLVLTIFEYWKRKHTNRAFKDYYKNEVDRQHNYSAIVKMSVFVLISIISSTWGAKKGTIEFAPTAKTIERDSLLEAKRVYLADLNQQIADARNTKWKGTTTSTSQRTINQLSAEKVTVTADISKLEKDLEAKNKTILANHEGETVEASYFFACLAIFIELAFLGCIAYLWNFRKKVMFEKGLYNGTIKPTYYIFDSATTAKKTPTLPVLKPQKKVLGNDTLRMPTQRNYETVAAPIAAQMDKGLSDANKADEPQNYKDGPTTQSEPTKEHKAAKKKGKRKKKKQKKVRQIGFRLPKRKATKEPVEPTKEGTENQNVDGETTVNETKEQNTNNQSPDGKKNHRNTVNANGEKVRYCKRCEKEFTFKHWNKKYCSDKCRQKAWEERTGKQLIKGKKKS